jgi:hypothetical protein
MNGSPADLERFRGEAPASQQRYFKGELDNLAVWKTARGKNDTRAKPHESAQGTEYGPVGFWNFDDFNQATFPTKRSLGPLGSDFQRLDTLPDGRGSFVRTQREREEAPENLAATPIRIDTPRLLAIRLPLPTVVDW